MKGNLYDISGILLVLVIIVVMFVAFVLLYINIYNKRHQRYLGEKKRMVEAFQLELLQSQLEIQERTLQNISQEIHDNIGQTLTMAKLNLSTMPVQQEQTEKVSMAKSAISKAISDLRDLSKSLNTDHIADLGLQQAIENELELVRKSAGLATSLRASGIPFEIERSNALILFRIVQEVLANIVKHASATSAEVELNYSNNNLELFVRDNGKGFTPPDSLTGSGSGLGLRNMNNRAKVLGAHLLIGPNPGGGTAVRLWMPGAGEADL